MNSPATPRPLVSDAPRRIACFLIVTLVAMGALASDAAAQGDEVPAGLGHPFGVGDVPADDFREPDPRLAAGERPARGGRVTVHLETRPVHLNRVLHASSYATRILGEVHARLLELDPETWQYEPSVAEAYTIEDALLLGEDWPDEPTRVIYGEVTEDGEAGEYVVTPRSSANPLEKPVRIAKEQVERVLPGVALTFDLREGVTWHDGHAFDASDVVFSLDCYLDPHVPADHARHRFQRLVAYDAPDERTVRVFFREPYFMAKELFGSDLVLLPRHVYDLTDADHETTKPKASPAERAKYLVEHPANEQWVGLGPYRITRYDDQVIEAERFDDYFDPANGGWVDGIRWRIVGADSASRQALLEGEFDFFTRLRSRDYLGDFAKQEAFVERFDKGTYYTPQMTYVAWNLRRKKFADVRVRRALAHAFDWAEFIDTIGSGMGRQVTASWYCFAPEYDRELAPYPFDLETAEELLLEAGWFDRDGDGLIDKDDEAFTFEYLFSSNDAVARLVGLKLKENLERLGIEMTLVPRDFATRQEEVGARDFDAACMTWILGRRTDPFAMWHSKTSAEPRTNNHPGYANPKADALIDAISLERDEAVRNRLYHELQRAIYADQPYLFGCLFPTKFAVSKRVRGVERFFLDPGYSIRRWYVETEPVPEVEPESTTRGDATD